MVVQVTIDPKAGRDLASLSRKLKTLGDGRTVPREFRASLRRDVQPALRDAKAAARSLPAHTGRSTGLRADIARNTTMQLKISGNPRIAIRIKRAALGKRGDLPRDINKGYWKHPTFGHRPIVVQIGSRHWYDDVMRKSAPNVIRGLNSTADKFEARLKV